MGAQWLLFDIEKVCKWNKGNDSSSPELFSQSWDTFHLHLKMSGSKGRAHFHESPTLRGGYGSGGRVVVYQLWDWWFNSRLQVSLGKTLNSKLPTDCQVSYITALPSVCVLVCANG